MAPPKLSREWEEVSISSQIQLNLQWISITVVDCSWLDPSSPPVQFIAKNPLPPLPKDIHSAREAIKQRGENVASYLRDPKFAILAEKVTVTNTTITLQEVPSHKFPIRVYAPSNRDRQPGGLPIALYFHGGYWCAGDVNTEDLGCRAMIAHGNDIVIVSFEYRLAPEHSWDTIFSDAEHAMKWVAANASTF